MMSSSAIILDPPNLRAQPGRRLVAAWVYDFLPYYWIAVVSMQALSYIFGAAIIEKVPLMVPALLLFLTRDYYFEGRGIGKNFLGLQVIDTKTGGSPTMLQSVIRNFPFVGPYLIYQLAVLIFFLVPMPHSEPVLLIVKYIAQAWAILLLPIEGYLMHRGNGRRLADRLSGTTVIFQNRDFSNLQSIVSREITRV
ncbi:MAG: RDD family protein [Candidatus Melainabacteria bacterium]|nr:RDD family protein [Candidatus Melainabacteria bacterium]